MASSNLPTDQYVEVGILIQIADGIDGEPHTVFADWNEVRYTLPPGTKLYARVPADDVPPEPSVSAPVGCSCQWTDLAWGRVIDSPNPSCPIHGAPQSTRSVTTTEKT